MTAAAAAWKARAWSGSSEVGRPQANAGMEPGPFRAAGFSAFAVTAAPAAVVSRNLVLRRIPR